mmetsp:Transcript_56038/g.146097  ORF Transcript_56038/g.146097 Transcript_56038/m.146097 type:complete len:265 (+) Transcript_56038:221-1015(+)
MRWWRRDRAPWGTQSRRVANCCTRCIPEDCPDLRDAIARVVAAQVLVVLCEALVAHVRARVLRVAVPLVEAEPVVLAVHGQAVVPNLLAAEERALVELPQVHDDLPRELWDRHIAEPLLPDDLAVEEPSDAIRKPLEGVGVEVPSEVEGRLILLGAVHVQAELLDVLARDHVRGHPATGVPENLDVDLAPMLEFPIAEDEHGRDEIPIGLGGARLNRRRLHAHLVASVAEHVVLRTDLATARGLVVWDDVHLSMGARLRMRGAT